MTVRVVRICEGGKRIPDVGFGVISMTVPDRQQSFNQPGKAARGNGNMGTRLAKHPASL
ncbi:MULTISPECIES: hypothetical protein [Cupriavidus]